MVLIEDFCFNLQSLKDFNNQNWIELNYGHSKISLKNVK